MSDTTTEEATKILENLDWDARCTASTLGLHCSKPAVWAIRYLAHCERGSIRASLPCDEHYKHLIRSWWCEDCGTTRYDFTERIVNIERIRP